MAAPGPSVPAPEEGVASIIDTYIQNASRGAYGLVKIINVRPANGKDSFRLVVKAVEPDSHNTTGHELRVMYVPSLLSEHLWARTIQLICGPYISMTSYAVAPFFYGNESAHPFSEKMAPTPFREPTVAVVLAAMKNDLGGYVYDNPVFDSPIELGDLDVSYHALSDRGIPNNLGAVLAPHIATQAMFHKMRTWSDAAAERNSDMRGAFIHGDIKSGNIGVIKHAHAKIVHVKYNSQHDASRMSTNIANPNLIHYPYASFGAVENELSYFSQYGGAAIDIGFASVVAFMTFEQMTAKPIMIAPSSQGNIVEYTAANFDAHKVDGANTRAAQWLGRPEASGLLLSLDGKKHQLERPEIRSTAAIMQRTLARDGPWNRRIWYGNYVTPGYEAPEYAYSLRLALRVDMYDAQKLMYTPDKIPHKRRLICGITPDMWANWHMFQADPTMIDVYAAGISLLSDLDTRARGSVFVGRRDSAILRLLVNKFPRVSISMLDRENWLADHDNMFGYATERSHVPLGHRPIETTVGYRIALYIALRMIQAAYGVRAKAFGSGHVTEIDQLPADGSVHLGDLMTSRGYSSQNVNLSFRDGLVPPTAAAHVLSLETLTLALIWNEADQLYGKSRDVVGEYENQVPAWDDVFWQMKTNDPMYAQKTKHNYTIWYDAFTELTKHALWTDYILPLYYTFCIAPRGVNRGVGVPTFVSNKSFMPDITREWEDYFIDHATMQLMIETNAISMIHFAPGIRMRTAYPAYNTLCMANVSCALSDSQTAGMTPEQIEIHRATSDRVDVTIDSRDEQLNLATRSNQISVSLNDDDQPVRLDQIIQTIAGYEPNLNRTDYRHGTAPSAPGAPAPSMPPLPVGDNGQLSPLSSHLVLPSDLSLSESTRREAIDFANAVEIDLLGPGPMFPSLSPPQSIGDRPIQIPSSAWDAVVPLQPGDTLDQIVESLVATLDDTDNHMNFPSPRPHNF